MSSPSKRHRFEVRQRRDGGTNRSATYSLRQRMFSLLYALAGWLALSVSQLIAATGEFDYVIFDEASQVLPEDAIPAILRGKHVIVAGDNKQLPPTTFFAATEDDDDGDPDATAYESL